MEFINSNLIRRGWGEILYNQAPEVFRRGSESGNRDISQGEIEKVES